jgi:hypothetical protein
MNQNDIYWLAGLLEGEGSFMKGAPSNKRLPIISMQTTDGDIAEKVGKMFNVKVYSRKRRQEHWKDVYSIRIIGSRAVELMKILKPLMGKRRQEQIQTALDSYVNTTKEEHASKLNWETVREIRVKMASGQSVKELSQLYNISDKNLFKIKNGSIWKE